MHLNPQKSRKAHTEIGTRSTTAAASSLSRPQDSQARGYCDPRGSHPMASRGDAIGQPFPLGDVVGEPLRLHRPIPQRQLRPVYSNRDRFMRARMAGEPALLVVEPAHDHPTARMLVNLIGAAVLIVGIAVQFR